MQALYFFSVYLHILSAITWIGGMFFMVLVLVPFLRKGDRATAAKVMREGGTRFRDVGWVCFVLLLITGTFNLYIRGVRLTSFVDPAWLSSDFGRTVLWKLGVFALVVAVSAVHDFILGPMATQAVTADPRSAEAEKLRRRASQLGRVNVLLALVLVALGVSLVRGLPF